MGYLTVALDKYPHLPVWDVEIKQYTVGALIITGYSEYLLIPMDFPKVWFRSKRTWPHPPLCTFLL